MIYQISTSLLYDEPGVHPRRREGPAADPPIEIKEMSIF